MKSRVSYYFLAEGIDGGTKIPGVPGLDGAIELFEFGILGFERPSSASASSASRSRSVSPRAQFVIAPGKSFPVIAEHLSHGTVFPTARAYLTERVGVAGFGNAVRYDFTNLLFSSLEQCKKKRSSETLFRVTLAFEKVMFVFGLMSDILK